MKDLQVYQLPIISGFNHQMLLRLAILVGWASCPKAMAGILPAPQKAVRYSLFGSL